jgi:predicted short-subunit dehydrogenase-like oxidoreductase (DUF2520 family)
MGAMNELRVDVVSEILEMVLLKNYMRAISRVATSSMVQPQNIVVGFL